MWNLAIFMMLLPNTAAMIVPPVIRTVQPLMNPSIPKARKGVKAISLWKKLMRTGIPLSKRTLFSYFSGLTGM